MALTSNEIRSGGFVVDKTTGITITTPFTTGARWNGGNLVDPDGRLVVVNG